MEVAQLTARLNADTAAFHAQLTAAQAHMNRVEAQMHGLDGGRWLTNATASIMRVRDTIKETSNDADGLKISLAGAYQELRNMGHSDNAIRAMASSLDRAGEEARALEAHLDRVNRRYKEMKGYEQLPSGMYQLRNRGQFAGEGPLPYRPGMPLSDRYGAAYVVSPHQGETAFGRMDWPGWSSDDIKRMLLMQAGVPDQRRSNLGQYITPANETGLGRDGLMGRLFGARKAQQMADKAEDALQGEIRGMMGGGGGPGPGRRGPGAGYYDNRDPWGGRLFSGALPGGRRMDFETILSLTGLATAAAGPVGAGAGGLLAALPAAFEGLGGAIGVLVGAFHGISAKAFTSKEAFDALNPEQKKFVQTLRSLNAGLGKTLGNITQGTILPAATQALHSAFTPASMRAITGATQDFSDALATALKYWGQLIGSARFANAFADVMHHVAGYTRDFLEGVANLTDGLIHLQEAALPFTDWLDKVLLDFSKWFSATMKQQQANGGLLKFFDQAQKSLQVIGKTLASFVGFLHSFAEALGGMQAGFVVFETLGRLFDTLGAFLNRNQETLSDFFLGALGAINDVITVLQKMLDLLSPLLDAVDGVAKSLGGWTKVIDAVFAVLAAKFVAAKLGFLSMGTEAEAAATKINTSMGAALGPSSAAQLGMANIMTGFKNLLRIAAVPIAIELAFHATGTPGVLGFIEKMGAGALIGGSIAGPAGAVGGALAVPVFQAGGWLRGKIFGKGKKPFDPTENQSVTVTARPSSIVRAPEDGKIVSVAGGGLGPGNMGNVGAVTFVGRSTAMYEVEGIVNPSPVGWYKKGDTLGYVPAGGHFMVHYLKPDISRDVGMPPGASDGKGGRGGGPLPGTEGLGGVTNPVPGGGSIIGTPGVGTHNQSDWQSGNAIDVSVKAGVVIVSPVDGWVDHVSPFTDMHSSGSKRIYGASITINGNDGNSYFITHLRTIAPAVNRAKAPVKKGQPIGTAGRIGHVHIGVQRGSPMDIPGLMQGDTGVGGRTDWGGGGGGGTAPGSADSQYAVTAAQMAQKYGVDPYLFAGLIKKESNWVPTARSDAGAVGLTQLMPGTARGLGVNPLNPAENLEGGAKYFAEMLRLTGGDMFQALIAYNEGPAAWKAGKRYAESVKYAQAVLANARNYRSQGSGDPFGTPAPFPTDNTDKTGRKPSVTDRVFPPAHRTAIAKAQQAVEEAKTPLQVAKAHHNLLKVLQDQLDWIDKQHRKGKDDLVLQRQRLQIQKQINRELEWGANLPVKSVVAQLQAHQKLVKDQSRLADARTALGNADTPQAKLKAAENVQKIAKQVIADAQHEHAILERQKKILEHKNVNGKDYLALQKQISALIDKEQKDEDVITKAKRAQTQAVKQEKAAREAIRVAHDDARANAILNRQTGQTDATLRSLLRSLQKVKELSKDAYSNYLKLLHLADGSKVTVSFTGGAASGSAGLRQAVGDVKKNLDTARREIAEWDRFLKTHPHLSPSVKTAINQRIQDLGNEIKQGYSDLANIAQEAIDNFNEVFDAQTQATVDAMTQSMQDTIDAMQQALDDRIQEMTQAMEDHIKNMKVMVHSGAGDFRFGEGDETPAEQALRSFQQASENLDNQVALINAQSQLLQAKRGGDPAKIAEALRAVGSAQRDIMMSNLQKQAEIQRKAADKQLAAAQESYRRQETARIEAYRREGEEQIKEYERSAKAQITQYEEQRKRERDYYDNQIALAIWGWGTMIEILRGERAGGSCFPADTPILTPDGERPIQEFEIGDSIYVWDFGIEQVVESRVSEVLRHDDNEEILHLQTTLGDIVTTMEHPFWTGSEWMIAGDLLPGDRVVTLRGTALVYGSTIIQSDIPVFNLHVEHMDHNYFADGFLVHNFKPTPDSNNASGGPFINDLPPGLGWPGGDIGSAATLGRGGAGGRGNNVQVSVFLDGKEVSKGVTSYVRDEMVQIGLRNQNIFGGRA